jgi:hypothetical protein
MVKRKDEKAFGEYRAKLVILEVYDEMGRAMEVGRRTGRGWHRWLLIHRWRMRRGRALIYHYKYWGLDYPNFAQISSKLFKWLESPIQ